MRAALDAGYSQDEINAYLGIKPQPEPSIPQAFVDRVQSAADFKAQYEGKPYQQNGGFFGGTGLEAVSDTPTPSAIGRVLIAGAARHVKRLNPESALHRDDR